MQEEQKEIVGFLFINQPEDVTSRGYINILQRSLPKKTKIGHAGTLDRFATGLLIIGIGRPATRQFQHLIKLDKTYWIRAKLGELTDTLDYTGTIINSCAEDQVSLEELEQAVASFQNGYEQTPPLFSALKWHGKRLSDMARSKFWRKTKLARILKGKKKSVRIYELQLLEYRVPYMILLAHVSHGTYIRALVNDIAEKCDSFATTHELKRTSIGPFTLKQAVPFGQLDDLEAIENNLVSVEQVLYTYQNYIDQFQRT